MKRFFLQKLVRSYTDLSPSNDSRTYVCVSCIKCTVKYIIIFVLLNCMTFVGVPFPKNFSMIAKTILKRLFRVYAHIYHQHFAEVVQLGEEAHLNTSFKHFIFFVQEFNLIERKELAPLQELIEKLTTTNTKEPTLQR